LLAAFDDGNGIVGVGATANAPAEFVASVRRAATQRHGTELDYVCSTLALASVLQRIVFDPTARLTGILCTDSAPVRTQIPPEIIRHASVQFFDLENACLRAKLGGRVYDYHFVSVELPSDARDWALLDHRMRFMRELVDQGSQRTPAARRALQEFSSPQNQLEASAIKAMLREWDRRGWPITGNPRRRRPRKLV
jgi:hypothetical protein